LTAVEDFKAAQKVLLARCGVRAESRFVEAPAIRGRAHVLIAGEGPPLLLVIGGTIPAAFWAPLMSHLNGFSLHAVDLPGFGLTDAFTFRTETVRPTAVAFLEQVLDGLGLDAPPVLSQSMGSLWSTWLALDRPERVPAMVHVACTGFILGTSAPLPMRLLSVPPLGRLLLRMDRPSPKQADRIFAMVKEDVSELPELRNMLVACERLPDYGEAMINLMHACLRLSGARREVALTAEQLSRVSCPVRMIWGEDDPFGPPEAGRRAAAILGDASLHTVPGGHGPWFRNPEQVASLAVPFLREHAGTVKAGALPD
jgi:pimeloyl-ACP methyl ester carboxylesterase